ncbi:muscle, skeletal receptor tyrosine protein kinase-like [Montipora foliosa]|uniref:muscle, skeletal receptor tyrosine protein kinase-like n=1 Tax=Montipora foliosa TaxID=591990 RepID=UPI0035F219C8
MTSKLDSHIPQYGSRKLANSRFNFSSAGNNHSLILTDIQRSDAGQYRCLASNSDGNLTSAPATLTVHFAPAIVNQLPPGITRLTREGNEYIVFSCTVEGNPSPLLYWTKNGKRLNVIGNPRLSAVSWRGIHSLNIVNLSRSDAGLYQCVAVNSVGSVASHGESLRVYFAPEISYFPKNATTVEGQDVIFSCTIDGDPPPSVIWTKNGEELKLAENSRVNVSSTSNNHSLIFTGIQRSDAGEYRCSASNREGNLTSSPATLTVHSPPEFTINPRNAIAIKGENVTLRCKVYGNPVPDVKWTKDEKYISGNERMIVSDFGANTSSLTITDIVPGDTGQYRCVANNSVADATSSPGNILVKYKPAVEIVGLGKLSLAIGSQMQLTCRYNASPPVYEVKWVKDGPVIARNATVIGNERANISKFTVSESILTVISSITQDGGDYKCLVANVLGNSSATTSVIISQEPTAAPQNVRGKSISSTSILVTWEEVPPADRNGVILTHTVTYNSLTEGHNGSETVNSNKFHKELTNLKKFVNYSITVFSTNQIGDGPASNPIFVSTSEAKPTAAPQNVRGKSISSTSILVTWEEVPPADRNGVILTHTVTYNSLTEGHNGSETVNSNKFHKELTNLKKFVNYSITVFSTNQIGDGPASNPIFVSTSEAKPTAAPQNVRGKSISSTSILVTWEEVPPADRNGVISTHTVTYNSLTEGDNGSETVNSNKFHKELTNLKKFVNYSITVFSTNQIGDGPASNPIFVSTSEAIKDDRTSRRSFHIILGFACGFAFIFAVYIFIVFKRFRRKKKNTIIEVLDDEEDDVSMQEMRPEIMNELRDRNQQACAGQPALPGSDEDEAVVVDNEMYLVQMAFERNWEIPRERLEITETELGGGEFGVVRKGTYLRRDGNELPVAVKMLRDENDQNQRMALIQELEMLRKVGRHTNIVSLIGACSFEEPLCVVVEFVPGGSLDDVLLDSRIPAQTHDANYVNICSKLSERDLLKIAKDVANGMRHLESKLCVHRDLAARNILIGEGLVAKVADFGLSRDISQDVEYIKFTEGKVPWLWMSMESLRGINTTMSDVWCLGVVLWEIVTLGERPYTGIIGIVELFSMLQDGMRLEKPPHCSKELYDIMLQCWQETPEDRPTFKDLHSKLHSILSESAVTYINIAFFEEQRNETGEKDIPDNGV